MAVIEAEADAMWRAAVYASVCQLHLRGNVLLAEALRPEHVKDRPTGHWGTVPGTAWALVHVALAGDRTLIPLLGAGHAGVVQRSFSWLTGELARMRPAYTPDAHGLAALSTAFPETDGLGAEVVPGLAAGDYLGESSAAAWPSLRVPLWALRTGSSCPLLETESVRPRRRPQRGLLAWRYRQRRSYR
jgi:xylulose-5-phosphate/fructose-6-phosphate phosphoketolase